MLSSPDNPNHQFAYATFTQRLQAFVIDCLIFIPITVLQNYSILYSKSYGIVVLAAVAWFVYKPFMELKYGATFGKKIMKLKVVNVAGQLPDFNQVMMRFLPYFAVGISNLLLYYNLFQIPEFLQTQSLEEITKLQRASSSAILGFASVFYTVSITFIFTDPNRQALHDRMSATYCIHQA